MRRTIGTLLSVIAFNLLGCPQMYDNSPAASQKEIDAMQARYQALIDEAKRIESGRELNLLHHFSQGALSNFTPEEFRQKVQTFVAVVKSNKLQPLEFHGGRAPGKVRLLLVTSGLGKGAVPFVKGVDGWKIDNLDPAFGDYEAKLNLDGTPPKRPPSSLLSLAMLQDPQSSALDRVQAALKLATAQDKTTAQRFVQLEKDIWPKTALLYAIWKSGGKCGPFAASFPIQGDKQKELYNDDTQAYRDMLKGLVECAKTSTKALIKVYKGCNKVEAGARSEYVDPLVELANANPKAMLQIAAKLKIPLAKDPVANILIGGLHGEQKSAFYRHVKKLAKKRRRGGRAAKLAKKWLRKMNELDKSEPPGSEGKAEY